MPYGMTAAKRVVRYAASLLLAVLTPALLSAAETASDEAALRETKLEDLGRALFFDVNLSLGRNQSCATCHDPARAFVDWRDNGVGAAASMGDDLHSLGDRNAPTISYASQIPPFGRDAVGEYIGGLFWDGRARDLEEQAAGPTLNALEMAMPDQATMRMRLLENANYGHAFRNLFGDDVLETEESTYAALMASIAAFERTAFFSPFDSKYDRYLRGEYEPNDEEALGMTLFFSNQFTNCNKCHQLNALPETELETFTNYKYRNIGVPANHALRQANGLGLDHVDLGLLENPQVDDPAQAGRFRVPTLRNVAITGPYMHNGVFKDLRTVVLFYNKYLTRSSKAQINPETGEEWGAPEVPENLALEELESGRALDTRSVDALIAFMRMLTDKRYEPLLEFDNAQGERD